MFAAERRNAGASWVSRPQAEGLMLARNQRTAEADQETLLDKPSDHTAVDQAAVGQPIVLHSVRAIDVDVTAGSVDARHEGDLRLSRLRRFRRG